MSGCVSRYKVTEMESERWGERERRRNGGARVWRRFERERAGSGRRSGEKGMEKERE